MDLATIAPLSSCIAAFVAIYLLGKLVLLVAKYNSYAKVIDKIPGPYPWPVLGNGWDLWVPHQDMFMTLMKLINEYEKESLVRLWLGPGAYVFAKKATAIETILSSSKHITKSDDYKHAHNWLGLGLLTSTGERWQKRRKMLTPSFHFRILDDFIIVFNEQSKVLVELLRGKAKKGEKFNLYPYITRCALDIICESAMGKNVNAQQQADSEYVKSVYGMGTIWFLRVLRPWLTPDIIFNLTSHRRNEKAYLQVLHSFSRKVIQERKEILSKKTVDKKTSSESEQVFGAKKRLAFLDLLLEASTEDGQRLADEEIREEVDTFMFEGHDTTAAGISWALYLLGRHPEIQRKVQEELKEVLGEGSDRPITTADVAKLKYLEAVIKETLRFYPSVPIYGRKLFEEVVIDGKLIPPDTTVFVGAIFAHRDPEVFPDPEKFDPNRFMSDAVVGRHPYSYVPFSAGPRNCIGQKFAVMEEKVVIAEVLRNFDIIAHDNPDDLKLLVEPILRPAEGITVTVKERKMAAY